MDAAGGDLGPVDNVQEHHFEPAARRSAFGPEVEHLPQHPAATAASSAHQRKSPTQRALACRTPSQGVFNGPFHKQRRRHGPVVDERPVDSCHWHAALHHPVDWIPAQGAVEHDALRPRACGLGRRQLDDVFVRAVKPVDSRR
jgi:hypothetical protein